MPSSLVRAQLVDQRLVSRIWQRDTSAFLSPNAPEASHAAVRNRLGWLDAPNTMAAHLADIDAFRSGLDADGLTQIYLLGMGGSSLCAEVLRDVSPSRAGHARLVVLDTTDEHAVRTATETLAPTRACFIVASKSGSTIEVTSLERHFWSTMARSCGTDTGRHFVAITDPGTALVAHAAKCHYRHTFVNPPDIGGRFSALSLFGLVPAALVGADPARLLESARGLAAACRIDDPDNPGLALGAFMAATAAAGRDKLTILLPDELAALGAWIEQLVAESTGKDGRGVLPVVGEPLGPPTGYGPDRAFVVTSTWAAPEILEAARTLQAVGHPVFRIDAQDGALGREFFRWEFATAVAGAILGVNPFDEPNVREAKVRTRRQLEARKTGAFRLEPPLEPGPGFSWREHRPADHTTRRDGRYLALLDYLPADARSRSTVDEFRATIQADRAVAITHGIGPRYLHSTGQYHKGGPNTGLFLLLTADDRTATPVPDTDYTFSVLKYAQALGDFDALVAAGREVLHYHLHDAAAGLAAARQDIVDRLGQP